MPRILYVATVVKTHIMEFHVPYLKMLKDMGWETAVAARNDYENPSDCSIPYCDEYYDIPFERNPFKPGNTKAYIDLKRIIDKGNFDIIHCHTPVGGFVGRLAARKSRKNGTQVFYTAHGFHFYSGAPLINWVLYYPAERWMAHMTDVLITITKEDYYRAQRFCTKQIKYIHGIGIDLEQFKKRSNSNRIIGLRRKFGIPEEATVLLSVGEVNKNKNHRIIIDALQKFPGVWFVLCGRGPLMESHKKHAIDLGVENRVVMAGYREDVKDFYEMADIFVFPSIREGLPVALMEAMASELLCVASKNRGTDDLMKDSNLLFDPLDKNELVEKLTMAIEEDNREEISNYKITLRQFDLKNSLADVKALYETCK